MGKSTIFALKRRLPVSWPTILALYAIRPAWQLTLTYVVVNIG